MTDPLTLAEREALAAMGLIEIAEPRADGSYPDNMPMVLTRRGADVFYPLVDHSRDLDFWLGCGCQECKDERAALRRSAGPGGES
jgi:hypothetical protein